MNTSQFTKLWRRTPKFTARVALLSLVTLAAMGMYNCANPIMRSQMNSGAGHSMAPCLPGQNCGMDINQHLRIWQSMFVASFNSVGFNWLGSLFMAGLALAVFKIWPVPKIYSRIARYLYYEREHPDSKRYNYLLGIFRSGLLQPKLFA